jgi:hypothetical protein
MSCRHGRTRGPPAGDVAARGRSPPALLRPPWQALRLFVREVKRAELFRRAAAIAYTTLFALVPLFTTSLAFFTAFPALRDERERVQSLLFENLLPGAALRSAGFELERERAQREETVEDDQRRARRASGVHDRCDPTLGRCGRRHHDFPP